MKNTTIEPEMITLNVHQAAKLLNISPNTAYLLVNQPDFPSFRVGKRILINREKLQEWVNRQTNSSKWMEGVLYD